MSGYDLMQQDYLMLIVLIASAFVGSFIGVVIERHEKGQQFLVGRSCCDHCHRTLSVVDLIPLLGWALLRGRCRYCHCDLGWFYPAVEMATLLISGSAFFLMEGQSSECVVVTLVLGWTLLTLALIDARTLLLPDWLTLPLLSLGLTQAALFDPDLAPNHLSASVLGFSLFVVIEKLYRRFRGQPGLGRGDAKLLAAAGAWVGLDGLPTVLAIAGCAGLLQAIMSGKGLSGRTIVPFGPGLALGLWLTWLLGPI